MSKTRLTLKDVLAKEDLLYPGHRACAGCVAAAAFRMVLKATRGPR